MTIRWGLLFFLNEQLLTIGMHLILHRRKYPQMKAKGKGNKTESTWTSLLLNPSSIVLARSMLRCPHQLPLLYKELLLITQQTPPKTHPWCIKKQMWAEGQWKSQTRYCAGYRRHLIHFLCCRTVKNSFLLLSHLIETSRHRRDAASTHPHSENPNTAAANCLSSVWSRDQGHHNNCDFLQRENGPVQGH